MTALVSMTGQQKTPSGPDYAYALLARIKVAFDEAERDALLCSLLASDRPTTVSFINAHAINLIWNCPDAFEAFAHSDILLRDGLGAELWMKGLGLAPGLNLNGTDLIPQLLDKLEGGGVALFGTTEPYLEIAASNLRARGIDVVAMANGFCDTQTYCQLLAQYRPRIIVLAMGMPKQEKIAYQLQQQAGYPCLIVCGGAVVDFLAGRFLRAPRILRENGLEWMFRLALEPVRLFRRYVIGVPISLYRLTLTLLSRPQSRLVSPKQR